MEQEKDSKFEFLHEKISEVDERMGEINEQTNKKFLIIKENVTLISISHK